MSGINDEGEESLGTGLDRQVDKLAGKSSLAFRRWDQQITDYQISKKWYDFFPLTNHPTH
jgi:hypothetical protein